MEALPYRYTISFEYPWAKKTSVIGGESTKKVVEKDTDPINNRTCNVHHKCNKTSNTTCQGILNSCGKFQMFAEMNYGGEAEKHGKYCIFPQMEKNQNEGRVSLCRISELALAVTRARCHLQYARGWYCMMNVERWMCVL